MKFITPGRKPVEFEIEDDWLNEAGVHQSKPSDKSYHVPEKAVFRIILLVNIAPPAIHRLTNFDRKRMISILRAFKENTPLPAIEVEEIDDPDYLYKVHSGFHRFYASVATGFTEIAATRFF
jgi:hypothetical protein